MCIRDSSLTKESIKKLPHYSKSTSLILVSSMDLSEKKSKIIINPKKEDLMKESIRAIVKADIESLRVPRKRSSEVIHNSDI